MREQVINRNTRVNKLTRSQQQDIRYQLKQQGYFEEDVKLAFNGKLSELADMIDIYSVVEC